MTATQVAEALGMRTHPEGGWYAETWRAPGIAGQRPPGSAILYLLAAGERSHWHRLDAAEVWQWSAGEALELLTWSPGDPTIVSHRLGGDVTPGTRPRPSSRPGPGRRPVHWAQWALVGCIVAPAFEFDGWELAPDGWEPPI